MGVLVGRVIVITGAGRGIGRAEALFCAREGATVLVNDLGCDWNGEGADPAVAQAVAREIVDGGGRAIAHVGDVATVAAAQEVIETALREWGRVDGVVNNAGILRDWINYNMPAEDWDRVLATHLTAPFLVCQAACRHWYEQSRRGTAVSARIVNTTSASGLLGNRGQANYGAAKAGVATLTRILAMEMRRVGVTVNAIAPAARTRLTENSMRLPSPGEHGDALSPDNIPPLVAYLLSDASAHITGQVFGIYGGTLELYQGWSVANAVQTPARWSPQDIAARMTHLFGDRSTSYNQRMTPAMFGVAPVAGGGDQAGRAARVAHATEPGAAGVPATGVHR
jgi:NAD(P)-dependent dehydrogenase (short-subunit alcohol dehydrogenase family)